MTRFTVGWPCSCPPSIPKPPAYTMPWYAEKNVQCRCTLFLELCHLFLSLATIRTRCVLNVEWWRLYLNMVKGPFLPSQVIMEMNGPPNVTKYNSIHRSASLSFVPTDAGRRSTEGRCWYCDLRSHAIWLPSIHFRISLIQKLRMWYALVPSSCGCCPTCYPAIKIPLDSSWFL